MPSHYTRTEREAIACPQCHAAPGDPCRNYAGNRCAPHGVRKPTPPQTEAQREARRQELAARTTRAPETPPAPPPTPARELPPIAVPDDAVRDAEQMLRAWGARATISALQTALHVHLQARPVSEYPDISDASRMLQMRRKVSA